MLKDFSFKSYQLLLNKLIDNGYGFQTFRDFLINPQNKTILLRHDIDLKKRSSLKIASLEKKMNICSTFYFRAVSQIFDEKIIKSIAEMGHEIGYHYENLALAKGNYETAMVLFKKHLEMFRKITRINTICMHGNSLSKFDNRKLWEKYSYRDFGIIGEPYFDLDFNKVLYLTDTAQRWNGSDISVRDHVKSNFNYSFRTTFDIINNINKLPDTIMLTVHPDRWTDNPLEWYRIHYTVKIKNFIKKNILKKRHN